jgi:adenylate cyclase
LADEQSIHADPLYLSALASLGANIPATLKMAPEGSSVAVLPFVDLSGEAGHEHFVDGLTEDIITDLSNVTGFFVIARNSTLAYKGKPTDVRQIAHDLGVKYVLEGSVRRSGQRLRVNVQLIDARGGGNHVWAERFDRDLADIFEVQDEVTKHIVGSISGKLSGNSVPERYRPSSLEAYELCVKSRDLFAQSSTATREAISQL